VSTPRFLALTAACLLAATPATAQAQAAAQPAAPQPASTRPEKPWSVDFGLGWDNSISGNINSGAIGTLNGQATAILPNRYEDVYGTGLHLRFGGGYKLDSLNEVRVTFTYQSIDADLTQLGDIGASKLYAQYDPYKSLTLDVGIRRYVPNTVQGVRLYAEGLIGIGFISELDVELVAPGSNIIFDASDFYDATTAFTMSANMGILFNVHKQIDLNAQIGLRYLSGLSDVDAFAGTGLEDLNSHTSRWTIPFIIGISMRF
jgi:opacity protein-like surface antigen